MPSSVSDNEEENTFMVSAADDIVEMIMARTSHTGGTLDLSESLDNRGLDSMEVVSLIFDIEEKFNIQIPPQRDGHSPTTETPIRAVFLSEGATVPHWYGGLRDIASLVTGTAGSWA